MGDSEGKKTRATVVDHTEPELELWSTLDPINPSHPLINIVFRSQSASGIRKRSTGQTDEFSSGQQEARIRVRTKEKIKVPRRRVRIFSLINQRYV